MLNSVYILCFQLLCLQNLTCVELDLEVIISNLSQTMWQRKIYGTELLIEAI